MRGTASCWIPDSGHHHTAKAFTEEETSADDYNDSLLRRSGISQAYAGSSAGLFPSNAVLIKTLGCSQTESSLLCVWLRMGLIKVTARVFKTWNFTPRHLFSCAPPPPRLSWAANSRPAHAKITFNGWLHEWSPVFSTCESFTCCGLYLLYPIFHTFHHMSLEKICWYHLIHELWQKPSGETEAVSLLLICSSGYQLLLLWYVFSPTFGGSFLQITASFSYESDEKK